MRPSWGFFIFLPALFPAISASAPSPLLQAGLAMQYLVRFDMEWIQDMPSRQSIQRR